jgi:AcrR family transcriptional regulator
MAVTPSSAGLRADSARVRARMLAEARRLLEAGDTDLPMNTLAKAAGVGVGTVYRHFPSHRALLEALAEPGYAALVAAARAAADDPDPAAGLADLLRAALRAQLTDPSLAAVLSTPEATCRSTVDLGQELGELARQVLDRARAAGAVRPDVTPDDVRRLTCGVQHAVRSGEDLTAVDRYLEILVDGLRARP